MSTSFNLAQVFRNLRNDFINDLESSLSTGAQNMGQNGRLETFEIFEKFVNRDSSILP